MAQEKSSIDDVNFNTKVIFIRISESTKWEMKKIFQIRSGVIG